MPSAIATLDELKRELDASRDIDDDLLQSILDGVSTRVETYTGRLFHPDPPLDNAGEDTAAPVTKSVRLPRRFLRWSEWGDDHPRTRMIDIPEAREIESVTGAAVEITGFEPLNDPPWGRIQVFGLTVPPQPAITALPALTVIGKFGWWPPPADLKDAVLLMAARRSKERDAQYADTVQLAEGITVAFFRQFPATVQATIESYVRRRGALP